MTTKPYVVLGPHTHFEYTAEGRNVWCTHGGWGGTLTINENGTCHIYISRNNYITYSSYTFTDAASYTEAVELGIITR